MKRIFLVHGWGGSPQNDFFPWLAEHLRSRGFEVHVPTMPDAEAPVIDTWVHKLAEEVGTADANAYFVGHSIGCQTILRYLESVDTPVGGAVFVAGWFNLENLESDEEVAIARPWIQTPIDTAKVRSVLPAATLVISDDDPYGCLEENREKFASIVTKEVVVPGAGHFNPEDGYTEFPLVVEELEIIMAEK